MSGDFKRVVRTVDDKRHYCAALPRERGPGPSSRGLWRLEASATPPILFDMEHSSTLKILPWAANLATIATVLGATWWSSDHRPPNGDTAQTRIAAPTAAAREPMANPAIWPSQADTQQAGGVKSLAFNTVRRSSPNP